MLCTVGATSQIQAADTLAKIKKEHNCQVVHISTDCVFNGKKGNYNEEDDHDCLDVYGKTKSLGENPDLTIIRTSIIGEEITNKRSLVEWVKSNTSKEINGFIKHFWNGVTCLQLAKIIYKIITNSHIIYIK